MFLVQTGIDQQLLLLDLKFKSKWRILDVLDKEVQNVGLVLGDWNAVHDAETSENLQVLLRLFTLHELLNQHFDQLLSDKVVHDKVVTT